MRFMVYVPTSGEVLRSGECPEEMFSIQADVGEVVVSVPEGIAQPEDYYVEVGELVVKPPKPSPHHRFDYTTKYWVDPRTLADLKLIKTQEINAARLKANRSTFTYAGKVISCDELSRSDIDGVNGHVSLTGELPPNWPGGWKVVDNTYVPIPDVATWIAFYSAMVAQGQDNFAHSQTLKATLEAAVSPEDVAMIVW